MDRGEIIIYQTADGETRLDVRMENDSVWLTQAQMVELFNSTKQNVSLHINNIFKEGELEREATVKEYLIVRQEGNRSVRRKITVYNLDVIISVGYRVKSQRGTQFRIWANKVLREYLIKGYAVNSQAKAEQLEELKKTVRLLSKGCYEIRGGRAAARDYGLHLRPRYARPLRLSAIGGIGHYI